MRMGEVIEQTGVPRELIHHYLRTNILPQPKKKGRYNDRQVQLLQQLRRLREDHNLPLELVRQVFKLFDFDPARIEPLTLADSLNQRLAAFFQSEEVLTQPTMTAEQVAVSSGIALERLKNYREAHLVNPVLEGGEERFTRFDSRVIALCEHGVQMGIPFDSLRTIGAYVRVAFELERNVLFGTDDAGRNGVMDILIQVFVRREMVTAFIQSLLQSLIAYHLHSFVDPGSVTHPDLDQIVFRPSTSFVKRHRIDLAVEERQKDMSFDGSAPEPWMEASRLLLHAGRYREAVFSLEQARQRWPRKKTLSRLYGLALILVGQLEGGASVLLPLLTGDDRDATSRIYLALSRFVQAGNWKTEASSARLAQEVRHLVDEALDINRTEHPAIRIEVRIFAGWLLSALPKAFRNTDRGLALLSETMQELEQGALEDSPYPGMNERYCINASYLLFDCLNRMGGAPRKTPSIPWSLDALRTCICTLDPKSEFADRVYLAGSVL